MEQLLAHRSGIGDYLDEDLLTVPAHTLTTTEDYLPIVDGFAHKFPPGERFSYCNGGYVVLALIAEDSGVSFQSIHQPDAGLTFSVISNTADGAWPIARCLREHLAD